MAAFQSAASITRLFATAASAADALLLLEALEAGTAGVLLRTESAAEVRQLMAYVAARNRQGAERLPLQPARVTRLQPVGMGDRVCVDMTVLLQPGACGPFAPHCVTFPGTCLRHSPATAGPKLHSCARDWHSDWGTCT